MPLADDTQAEIDLLAGTAELRRELESVKHQRDTWQRMAETAARQVQDLTAARDVAVTHANDAETHMLRYEQQIRDLKAARDAALAQAAEFLAERQEAMAKAMEAMAARDAALDQVRAMAQPSQIQTSPDAHAKELAKIQASIPPRNRVDVHAELPASALRNGDGGNFLPNLKPFRYD